MDQRDRLTHGGVLKNNLSSNPYKDTDAPSKYDNNMMAVHRDNAMLKDRFLRTHEKHQREIARRQTE